MTFANDPIHTAYDPIARRQSRGINGQILHVDLTTGELTVERPDDRFYRTYIGGRGFILHYLLTQTPARIDPLSPENLLIFAPGVLSGSMLPGSGRHGVGAKSPLTGALASSEVGGWWGAECKRAGFDAVVIRGAALHPVYLWLHEGAAELRDARHLWGMLTVDTQDALRAELGDDKVRLAVIGPAGENRVRYACIIHDGGRAAGRSGLGAVMGSKNLKAVAVRGSTGLGLARREDMLPVTKWIAGAYKDLMSWAVRIGTSASVGFLHRIGSTPVNNFRDPVFPGIEQLDAPHTFPLYMKEHDTCHACPVHCKPVVEYDQPGDPRKLDPRYGGPEYESIGALGPMCLVNDPLAVAKANELCAKFGLDTISTGATIAFTMECAEKGLLPADADFRPRFGSGEDLLAAVERIATRQGLGDWMAEGSARMARDIGPAAEELQATARGQELPMHDPRLKNCFGLGYALSPTGADHMHNMDDDFAANEGSDVCGRLRELGFEVPLPMFGLPEFKIRAFTTELAAKHFFDSAVLCQFYPYEYKHLVPALNAAAGWDVTTEELLQIGHRITHMARLYLLREGFTAADDKLPPRCFQPHTEGPNAGRALTPRDLQDALQTYYRLMDWTPEGVPTPAVLARYGLTGLAAGILG